MALWTSRKRVPARTGPSVSCSTSSASCQADRLAGSVKNAKTSSGARAISTVVLAMSRPYGGPAACATTDADRRRDEGWGSTHSWPRAFTSLLPLERGCRKFAAAAFALAGVGRRGARDGAARASGGGGGVAVAVAVELVQVVGGGDEPPFASACRAAAALEASDRAVELEAGRR